MCEKSESPYKIMQRKGYPEEFSRLICMEMNTDFTAEKMICYVSGEKKKLEDVADLVSLELTDEVAESAIREAVAEAGCEFAGIR